MDISTLVNLSIKDLNKQLRGMNRTEVSKQLMASGEEQGVIAILQIRSLLRTFRQFQLIAEIAKLFGVRQEFP